jgi:hypothetical protein
MKKTLLGSYLSAHNAYKFFRELLSLFVIPQSMAICNRRLAQRLLTANARIHPQSKEFLAAVVMKSQNLLYILAGSWHKHRRHLSRKILNPR